KKCLCRYWKKLFLQMFSRYHKNSTCFILFLFCFYGVAIGQSQPEQKLTPPPDSLFDESRYPANPDVPYIYSLKELNITFEEVNGSVIAVMNYHVRIKVFDASAPRASVVGIPYYRQNGIEK